MEKCKDFNYLLSFIKEIGIINFNYNINGQELKAFLINNFSALEVNYENIPNDNSIARSINIIKEKINLDTLLTN